MLDAAKTAFFSNVSHEFRTPLTLMLGPLEDALADRSAPLAAVQTARLTLAYDNALRLLKLVNALLDFSRLEAGRLRPHYAPIDLAAYTAKLAGMFESACEKAHLRLTIDCPSLWTPIWVDQDLWEKIVPNLMSNAFKFTFEGEIAVRMRETEQAASDVDRGRPPADAAPPPSGPRTHVLVVDDNADLRSYVAGLLTSSFAVTTASDGLAALQQVRTDPPDIIVSDVMMPNLDGFGLVRELRADPRTAALPVILLSARAGEDAAVEGLGTGADDYLAKPFSARELLARVRTHAELARTRREWTAQLEAADTELEAFSYSVSHDLRAPLRHVMGFAALLDQQMEEGNTERARAHTRTIIEAAAKMSRLIDDLLAFSRFARTPLAKRHVDLDEVVKDIRNELMTHVETARRDIEWRITPLPPIDADPSLIRQVLINLMSNAKRARPGRDVLYRPSQGVPIRTWNEQKYARNARNNWCHDSFDWRCVRRIG